jgi:hypothetical protein
MLQEIKDFILGEVKPQRLEAGEYPIDNWILEEIALARIPETDPVSIWDYITWEIKECSFDYILTDEFKARLREMRLRMIKPLIALKRLKHSLLDFFSLLFGLCSSESSLILDAYFGASLSRIPNL